MPIRAENKALYPDDWKLIRKRILERAQHRCEGTPDRPACEAVNGQPHPETGSRVVLTIAHMDRRLVDHSDGNLRALCQKCHNSWDAKDRAANATITRHEKLGQPDLIGRTWDEYPEVRNG